MQMSHWPGAPSCTNKKDEALSFHEAIAAQAQSLHPGNPLQPHFTHSPPACPPTLQSTKRQPSRQAQKALYRREVFIQLPLTSTTASVPSIAISSAPRAILLLLVHLFGLGNLDFTLEAKRTLGQVLWDKLRAAIVGRRPLRFLLSFYRRYSSYSNITGQQEDTHLTDKCVRLRWKTYCLPL